MPLALSIFEHWRLRMNEIYEYNGPVMHFEHIIEERWNGYTTAASEAQAKARLIFQYKKSHNMEKTMKIFLPGKVVKR